MATVKILLVLNRLFKNDDIGMIIARIKRYEVVIHCTVEVPIENSSINVGNVTFMAVSTTTPEKDIIPVAITERTSFALSSLLNIQSLLFSADIVTLFKVGFNTVVVFFEFLICFYL